MGSGFSWPTTAERSLYTAAVLGLIVFDEPRRAESVVPRERIRRNGKTAELDLCQRRSFGGSTLPEALRIDDW
jgi:hypothetical protein